MTPILEARGLTKRFGRTQALAGLDLVAQPGRVVALLGPNGAGKTTFVRAVATLLRPDAGSLQVAGIDVLRQPARVRQVIGLAGQFAAVEPAMTGRENLDMVGRLFGLKPKQARAAAIAVLEQIQLSEDADRLVRTYSGGMRRRLDLGASLVGAPRLLLLDEPTTGLDPGSRIQLWDAIRKLVAAGTDVLLADTALVTWSLVVSTALGFAVGFRMHGSVTAGLAAFGLCVLFSFAFEWVFITIGLVAGTAQAAQGMSVLMTLLVFVSSAYVPVSSMPNWLQPVAEHQPVTPMVNAVRGLVGGPQAKALLPHTTAHYVGLSLVWAAAIVVVFGAVAAVRFSRR